MSAPEAASASPPRLDAAESSAGQGRASAIRREQQFGTIVVVGGGCYGSYYLRQLTRALDAGAIAYHRIVVVDRDADCRVAVAAARSRATPTAGENSLAPTPVGAGGPPHREAATDWRVEPHHFAAVAIEIAPWEEFLPAYFDAACADPARFAADAVVPSPLMPHVAQRWIVSRARRRWPDRPVTCPPLDVPPGTPWQRAAADGATHYASFAEWMCPINCVEPARCPHTRGPRSWSMPDAARRYATEASERGRPLVGPLLFHCEHRAYGVGMFDTAAAVAADAALSTAVDSAAPHETIRALVASVSHCHGAWSVVEIGPRA